jgi:hypothetical protein
MLAGNPGRLAMLVTIEFFRVRVADAAQALVGRETAQAIDLADAISIGRRLGLSLHMPQRPDVLAITDEEGRILYASALDRPAGLDQDNNACEPPKTVQANQVHPRGLPGSILPFPRKDCVLNSWANEAGSMRPVPREAPGTRPIPWR